jgi:hypothetical protein
LPLATFRPESLASPAGQMALLLPKCQSVKFASLYHRLLLSYSTTFD